MNSRDRREFGRRKMRIKNKWEVVLVLIVIAAGIVITTVAAIKAKERRRMQVENRSNANNTIGSSVESHAREVANSHSGDHSTKDENRKRILPTDNAIKKAKTNDLPPDYDVEYDLVKSGADEYTAMASEAIDNIPRNRIRVLHDGLPGFPPPFGASNDFNSNVELSADAAGFVLENGEQTDSHHNREEVVLKTSANTNVEINSKAKPNESKAKTFTKLSNSNKENNNAAKGEVKRIPVFAEPPKVVSESVPMRHLEHKNDMKISIPVKMMSRIPGREKQMANVSPENSGSVRIPLPALEPAIRFLGLSDDLRHSNDYNLQASLANIPVHMRRFLSPEIGKPENVLQMNGNQYPNVRSKRESEKPLVLRQTKANPTHESSPSTGDESEPKTGESRYIPISERSFMSDSPEDNDSGDSERDSDDEIRPLFNFDDLENRFPTVLSSSRDHKHDDDSYSADESSAKKYGLLGSGNFEIIRGGVYAEDESATNNVPNYANENDNSMQNSDYNSDDNSRKSDQQVLQHYPPNSDQNNDDDSESNQFGPFNLDFFTGNPVLGFQGYDNFGATSVDKYKAPVPLRKVKGQRRHFHDFDSHSSDSNLHVITTDTDLYSDS